MWSKTKETTGYRLPYNQVLHELSMPVGAKILQVVAGERFDGPLLWVMQPRSPAKADMCLRTFYVLGCNAEISEELAAHLDFVGLAIYGKKVFEVFELKS